MAIALEVVLNVVWIWPPAPCSAVIEATAISAAIKEVITAHGIKMPQLAHAVRVLVCGRAQTPSIDAVLELFSREVVIARLSAG